MLRRRIISLSLAGVSVMLLAILAVVGFTSQRAYSKEASEPLLQTTRLPEQKSIGDDTCLACHGTPGLTITLENGETLSVYISPEDFANSIHGREGYACVQCHTTVGDFPHPPFSAKDVRDASLHLYQACRRCHISQYTLSLDSVHANALGTGNRNAAICTDCHTSHAVRRLTDPETGLLSPDAHEWIPQTCAKCHNAIYQKYLTSVHGSALVGEGNPDVPTCIDCHGVHNIEDPTTAAFRLRSPEICAGCHTDPQIMDKYGIPTQVLSTYVADFHGTTVTLFEKQHPDQETNKPVCYDCHGIHDIKRIDDPEEGLRIRGNILARCQVCHPDATANFPDAWLSHYIPSPEKTPLVYTVNLFYMLLIPGVLGGMAILVALDLSTQVRTRVRAHWKGRVTRRTQAAALETVDLSSEVAVGDPAGEFEQPSGESTPEVPSLPQQQTEKETEILSRNEESEDNEAHGGEEDKHD